MELRIENVSKQYGRDAWGVRDFSLQSGPGVLGLLGPNGAGKSTLMRMIAAITRPSGGEIFWNGDNIAHNPDNLRRTLGYCPQDFGVYPNLNAVEFLTYLAAAKGLRQSQHLIASSVRRADGVLLRIVSDAAPDPAAEPLPPNLKRNRVAQISLIWTNT